MAPISDKRSQQQPPNNNQQQQSASPSPQTSISHHGHSHSSHSHSKDTSGNSASPAYVSHSSGHGGHGHTHSHSHTTHTKENASGGKPHSKKGLEILDFHESWLEEMEIYKDKMFVQKSHKYQQQLFGSHNHVHTPQGVCQLDDFVAAAAAGGNGGNKNLLNVTIANQLNAAILNAASSSDAKRRAAGGSSAGSGASSSEQHSPGKSRVTVRSAATIAAAAAATAATAAANSAMNALTSASKASDAKQNGNVPLILKRSRDGSSYTSGKTTVTAASNAKRHANAHSHSIHPQHSGDQKGTKNASSPPPKSPAKVIVNQFHASSLLKSHSHHDEKTKILTQNGLTKSAASAYETSMYACNYLSQENRLSGGAAINIAAARHQNGDNNNYVGVSLASKSGGDYQDGRPMRDLKDVLGHTAEDDPCAAIDDVNDYTDSDSEEEYIGFPFYLEDDGVETHQSRNIRFHVDLESLISEDSETEERTEYYRPKTILTPSLFPNVPPYLNFSSHAQKGPPMPAALHKVLKWKLSPVMPKIVKRVVLNSGFRIIKNTTDWMAIWEKHMKSPGFRTIRSHQKYNHMPGSFRIGRKDSMWRSIYNNVKKFGTKEFGFMQKSYVMPDDLESLRQVWPKNASKLTKWIVKPPASARGTGIRIVNKWSQFPKDRPLVVQKYIERPLLINDNKFDMRIYVVVTSINPLRIYMYKDGLARFASVKYSSELNSLDDRCMHLTNYSINKFSQNYSKNEDFNACQGHKWTLQSLWSCLESRGVNTKRLWATLRNLVIKAIISGESGLNRMYRQNVNFRYNCFELFGFDVLLDENLIPWLLEINISPSLHSELPLDLHVKGPLIQAVLNTALYQVPPKLNEKQQKDILEELKLDGPLCHDKRVFTTCLTAEEVRKHNQFTNRSIEFREEYIDSILENLLPDDVRCLLITEDEYARSKPLERVFPTPDTHIYLKFVDNPRYYNRLLDAWEHRYGHCRDLGIELLSRLCEEGYHQLVSDAALEKEPNVQVTEIDMLHVKKSDDPVTSTAGDNNAGDSAHTSKAGSPDSHSSPAAVAVA